MTIADVQVTKPSTGYVTLRPSHMMNAKREGAEPHWPF